MGEIARFKYLNKREVIIQIHPNKMLTNNEYSD